MRPSNLDQVCLIFHLSAIVKHLEVPAPLTSILLIPALTPFTLVPTLFAPVPMLFMLIPTLFAPVPMLFMLIPTLFEPVPMLFMLIPTLFEPVPMPFAQDMKFIFALKYRLLSRTPRLHRTHPQNLLNLNLSFMCKSMLRGFKSTKVRVMS
jgi:hypothetical protein